MFSILGLVSTALLSAVTSSGLFVEEVSRAWSGPVVAPAEVVSALDDPDVVVLHFGDEERYREAHVPGAHFADAFDFQAPVVERDGVVVGLSVALPEPGELERVLRGFGIDDDSRIVLYWDNAQEPRLTRILLTLDWAGLGDRSAVMLGGLAGWEAAGGSVSAEPPSVPAAGNVSVRPRDDVTVSADEVAELSGTPGTVVIDARAAAFYDGVQEDRGRAGHIPGAASLPYRSLFTAERTYRSLDELRQLLADAGVRPGDRVIAYCHIGLFGTTVVLAARLLGHDAALYDGSWEEWGQSDRPAAIPSPGN